MEKKKHGAFIVSLDFELMWGVHDIVTIESYGENIKGVHVALPKILDFFVKYNIHGTFAIVGLLFFDTKKDMLNSMPDLKPKYKNSLLSPYGKYMDLNVNDDKNSDPYHFGAHLVRLIKDTPNQEIATHTFSHYCTMEKGQTPETFNADLKAAVAIATQWGIEMKSIVFPRNQINIDYLKHCAAVGITSFRDRERTWIYDSRTSGFARQFQRFFRIIDAYVNISGHYCYTDEFMKRQDLINIPGSRLLRAYSRKLRFLEGMRLQRVKDSMTYAAKNGLLFHLWWHPHNFGINQDENFYMLQRILQHYEYLKKQYGFKSYTMSEYSTLLLNK